MVVGSAAALEAEILTLEPLKVEGLPQAFETSDAAKVLPVLESLQVEGLPQASGTLDAAKVPSALESL